MFLLKTRLANTGRKDSGRQSGVLHGLLCVQSQSLPFMSLRVSCHFGGFTIELNLLTFLLFFFFLFCFLFFSYSFSSCRRKARSSSGCASGHLGLFCCLFSTVLWVLCVCICVHDLCLWAMVHVENLFFFQKEVCMHAYVVCAWATVPGT